MQYCPWHEAGHHADPVPFFFTPGVTLLCHEVVNNDSGQPFIADKSLILRVKERVVNDDN